MYEFFAMGGRLVDGLYGNGQEIGEAVRMAVRCGIPREEMFIVLKIEALSFGYGTTLAQFARDMESLAIDYVDLALLHTPYSYEHHHWNRCGTKEACHGETWRALGDLRAAGVVKELGVSNFGPRDIEQLLALDLAPVAVNQLEYHPWVPAEHRAVVEWCQARGIAVMATSSIEPLFDFGTNHFPHFARVTYRFAEVFNREAAPVLGRPDMSNWTAERPDQAEVAPIVARLREMAAPLERTVVQVLLRWAVQHNASVIPGTANLDHLRENLDLFSWKLTEQDMAFLDSTPGGLISYRSHHSPDPKPNLEYF